MSETKFTEGPWKEVRLPGNPGIQIARGNVIANVSRGSCWVDETDANAHLITAAPEMYEALELARGYLRAGNASMEQVIDAALAKARGEEAT